MGFEVSINYTNILIFLFGEIIYRDIVTRSIYRMPPSLIPTKPFTLTNYVIIIVIAAVLIYILYRMIKKRQSEKAGSAGVPGTLPYSDKETSEQLAQLNKIMKSTGTGITNFVPDPTTAYGAVKDYCIKSSFNSAYVGGGGGGYMDQKMVKYVLSRGCRFVDFEVYMKDDVPIVAYSSAIYDSCYNHFTSLNPALSLSGVFQTIMTNAFNQTVPNPGDPLFVQLRIKSYLPEAYSMIAQLVAGVLGDRLYQGIVEPTTPISSIMGKIVLIVDRLSSPGFDNYSTCAPDNMNCTSLKKYTNMVSGSDTVRIYRANDLMMQMTNPPDPSVYLMRVVMPQSAFFTGMSNSDSLTLIKNYGAQAVLECFYINDGKLAVYEAMFSQFKSAFVPISSALTYVQDQQI